MVLPCSGHCVVTAARRCRCLPHVYVVLHRDVMLTYRIDASLACAAGFADVVSGLAVP